jgi:osmotically-inducible protein OsmY
MRDFQRLSRRRACGIPIAPVSPGSNSERSQKMPTRKEYGEMSVSLLLGAGAGLTAMYLLDPKAGAKRRKRLRSTAANAMPALDTRYLHQLADRTRGMAGSIASKAGEMAHRFSTGEMCDRAEDAYEHARETARNKWRSLRDSDHAGESHHAGIAGVLSVVVGVLGAGALGAGILYLLDPQAGARRRKMLRVQAHLAQQRGSEAVQRQAEYLKGKARDAAAGAQSMLHRAGEAITDDALMASVREHLGSAIENASRVAVRIGNGIVTLSGSLSPEEAEEAAAATRKVEGVRDVVQQFNQPAK